MRIALFYNERAGRSPTAAELSDAILLGGHSLEQIVDIEGHARPDLKPGVELVVAAGGDGTVAEASSAVAGTGIPMAILPLGTANNIARSLHIEGSIEELVAHWEGAERVAFDMGVIHSAQGEQVFLESVGAGLVPAVIDSMKADISGPTEDLALKVARARQRYREILPLLTPTRWTMTADGVRFEDELLLFEVLNTSSIGPNLTLSSETSSSDGLLSVVVIGEENRRDLAKLLEATSNGREWSQALPVMHVRHIEIHGQDALHIDDTVHCSRALGAMSLSVEPGALTILA